MSDLTSKLFKAIASTPARTGRVTWTLDGPTTVNAPIVDVAAAIESAFVVIPRDELPEVEAHPADPKSLSVGGKRVPLSKVSYAYDWVLTDVAAWEYLKQSEKDAETKLAKRRDELAQELSDGVDGGYSLLSSFNKRAVDRIIELEAGK